MVKVMIGYKCSTTRTTMNYCAQILNINLYKDNKQLCDYNSKLNIGLWAREARDFFCFHNRFHCQLRGIGGRGGSRPEEFFEKFGETLHI